MTAADAVEETVATVGSHHDQIRVVFLGRVYYAFDHWATPQIFLPGPARHFGITGRGHRVRSADVQEDESSRRHIPSFNQSRGHCQRGLRGRCLSNRDEYLVQLDRPTLSIHKARRITRD